MSQTSTLPLCPQRLLPWPHETLQSLLSGTFCLKPINAPADDLLTRPGVPSTLIEAFEATRHGWRFQKFQPYLYPGPIAGRWDNGTLTTSRRGGTLVISARIRAGVFAMIKWLDGCSTPRQTAGRDTPRADCYGDGYQGEATGLDEVLAP